MEIHLLQAPRRTGILIVQEAVLYNKKQAPLEQSLGIADTQNVRNFFFAIFESPRIRAFFALMFNFFFTIFVAGEYITMGRIIAIDYGRKRTGLAVTDPGRIIASPLETVATAKLEEYLVDYLKREKVDAIVIGYPRKMNNQPSELIVQINPFIKRLSKIFEDINIHLVDERFTSGMAQKAMIEGGMKKSDRQKKENVDKISASLILQSYLEQVKNYSK